MAESLRGHFLVAGPRLKDTNFFKSVVLIFEHGDEGAMGVVINRPSSICVTHALGAHFKLPQTDDVVYVGGPVEPNALFIVHSADELSDGETPILPGLYVDTNADVFEEVVERAMCDNDGLPFRVFCGCAGWGPGQLEGELARGDWLTLPADIDFLFDENPYCVWERLVARVQEEHRLLPHRCDNPEWN